MICGIVLAAGKSRRMGAPKALLPLAGRTFVENAVAALRDGGCAEVWVVVTSEGDPAAERIRETALGAGAHVVVNPRPGSEQIDSLRVGLRALAPTAEAAVVTPVDVPGVRAVTVAGLIAGFRASGAPMVLAAYRGEHGHPVLFARAVWDELHADGLPDGARSVVHAHADDLHLVEVGDPAVLDDVDTPAELERLRERVG
ncbi:MAG: nucleotidyltransferase family protein [Gemmatimonadota bacterium]|jgi:nicotine blue oxidoreductase|nr:nucleotidyltransferase family protein [Gemmatimonadota bacterium]